MEDKDIKLIIGITCGTSGGFILALILYILRKWRRRRNNNSESHPNVVNSTLIQEGAYGEVRSTEESTTFSHYAGIPNYGNTCYLNSIIQVLACALKFIDLIAQSNRAEFKWLSKILDLVRSNGSPSSFKPLIESFLLELKQNYPMVAFYLVCKYGSKWLQRTHSILIDNFTDELKDNKNLFLIKKTNAFTCESGHKILNDEQQIFLTIPPNTKIESEKCIEDLKRKEENLELICEKCGCLRKTKIVLESLDLPEYLVFYVADTSNQHRIPKTHINDCKKEYELFGVICYYGSGSFGHYIAFTLNSDRIWIKYNDAFIDKEEPDYDHAYMLFYKQK